MSFINVNFGMDQTSQSGLTGELKQGEMEHGYTTMESS